ncbi:MAG TPA: alginate export family protein [Myxococcota bacterium]|nr:alginate export family protein [Myxococcota bacterium]
MGFVLVISRSLFPILALSVLTSFPAVAGDVESPAAIDSSLVSTREPGQDSGQDAVLVNEGQPASSSDPDLSPDSHVLEQTRRQVSELAIELSRLRDEVDSLKAGRRRGMKVKPDIYLRIRPEWTRNLASLGKAVESPVIGRTAGFDDDDCFSVSSRLQVGVTIDPAPGFRFKVLIQDSRRWGEEKDFRSNSNGTLDIFQAYMEFLDINKTGLNIRAGRSIMDLGSTIHVNSGSSGGTGQVFDGVWLNWFRKGVLTIDAFTTMVKTGIGPLLSDAVPEDWESFSGIHLATDRPLKWLDIEAYGFYLDDAFANITQKLGTVGGRVLLFPTDGLKLSVEAAAQFGRVTAWDADAVLQVKDHLAAVYLANASYQFLKARTQPKIGLFFLYASGDSTPWNGQSSAFKPVFGSTHNFLGYMDQLRPSGVWDIGLNFWMYPVKELTLNLDYHFFQQTGDGGFLQHFGTWAGNGSRNGVWTQDRGVLIPAGNSGFIGHELDLLAMWRPEEWLEVAWAYSVFFPGAALDGAVIRGVVGTEGDIASWKDQATLGGRTAHRMLVWATLSY